MASEMTVAVCLNGRIAEDDIVVTQACMFSMSARSLYRIDDTCAAWIRALKKPVRVDRNEALPFDLAIRG